jgi:hypothetical protein
MLVQLTSDEGCSPKIGLRRSRVCMCVHCETALFSISGTGGGAHENSILEQFAPVSGGHPLPETGTHC